MAEWVPHEKILWEIAPLWLPRCDSLWLFPAIPVRPPGVGAITNRPYCVRTVSRTVGLVSHSPSSHLGFLWAYPEDQSVCPGRGSVISVERASGVGIPPAGSPGHTLSHIYT